MTKERQRLGREGEERAEKFLRSEGYKVINRNFKTPFGEIDLIAYKRKVLVFIEVKARTSYNFGRPEESISEEKKKKISKVASLYLKAKKLNGVDCRFDVVALVLDKEKKVKIKLIENAFQLC